MSEWTDEALEQYARKVLLDALRADWDDTGQDAAFAASRRYENEMCAMVANPEAWYRKKAEPPWKRHIRRLSALAALIAVCALAVWALPDAGEAAAQAPLTPLSAAAMVFAAAAVVGIAIMIRNKRTK